MQLIITSSRSDAGVLVNAARASDIHCHKIMEAMVSCCRVAHFVTHLIIFYFASSTVKQEKKNDQIDPIIMDKMHTYGTFTNE